MMSELRWALLILGVIFIAVLAWWERRRPRQASGAFERAVPREGGTDGPQRLVREPPLTLPEVRVRDPVKELPVVGTLREDQPEQLEEAHEWEEREQREQIEEPEMPALEPAAPPPAAEAAELQREPEPVFDDEDTMDDLLAIVPAEEIPEDERATFDDDSEPVSTHATSAAPDAPMLRELPPAAPLRVEWPAEHERRILALRLVAPQRERFAWAAPLTF